MRSLIGILAACSVATAVIHGDQECGPNQIFKTCGTACEPSCDTPSPLICTLQCVVGCQCSDGYVRNSKKDCVPKDQCNASSPPSASPYTGSDKIPTPPSTKCPTNETFSQCTSSCSEPKCPTIFKIGIVCPRICNAGCTCQSGYVRDGAGECILEKDCPPLPALGPCATVRCTNGQVCEDSTGSAVCKKAVGPVPLNPCLVTECSTGLICDDSTGVAVCKKSSDSGSVALSPCSVTQCKDGFMCDDSAGIVECKREPSRDMPAPFSPCDVADCRPGTDCDDSSGEAICVPRPTLTCANVLCQVGYTCKMEYGTPRCVENGGHPFCNMFCRLGYVCKVINGNAQCVPSGDPPSDPPATPVCNILCRVGYACRIVNGKPTCVVMGPPTPVCNILCRVGYVCQIVNGRATCVLPGPPSIPPPVCNLLCIRGYVCKIVNGRAQCVESDDGNPMTCANVRCASPTFCAMVADQSCGSDLSTCKLTPTCINYNACAATTCSVGSQCILQQVTCVRAPCNPVARCVAPSNPNNCGTNQVYSTCITLCSDRKCNQPPVPCAQVCTGKGCVCAPNFFRDANNNCVSQSQCDMEGGCFTLKCPPGTSCQNALVKCLKPPCPTPPAMCVPDTPNCPVNETESGCTNACFEAKCPTIPPPSPICPQFCTAGCTCKSGYLRNTATGKCVLTTDCPPIRLIHPSSSPADPPTSPVDPPPSPISVPLIPAPLTCANIRCSTKGGCAMVADQSCGDDLKSCTLHPVCVESNACDTTHCPSGEECILQEVTCIRAPCNPVPRCVSSSEPHHCGNNEVYSDCVGPCSNRKCNGPILFCPAICQGKGCVCAPEYFRDKNNKCVSQKQCDIEEGNPRDPGSPDPSSPY